MKTYVNPNPLVASVGLPAWATVQLDGLLGSGIVHADELDGLRVHQLTALAASFIESTAAGEPFDAKTALAHVKTLGYPRRAESEAA